MHYLAATVFKDEVAGARKVRKDRRPIQSRICRIKMYARGVARLATDIQLNCRISRGAINARGGVGARESNLLAE